MNLESMVLKNTVNIAKNATIIAMMVKVMWFILTGVGIQVILFFTNYFLKIKK